MKKLTLFILSTLIFIPTALLQCMEPAPMERAIVDISHRTHYPIHLPTTGDDANARNYLSEKSSDYDFYDKMGYLSFVYPITSPFKEKSHQRMGICHTLAMQNFLGITDPQVMSLKIPACTDLIYGLNILQKYCIPVAQEHAQPNDLVIYANQLNNTTYRVRHSAVYKGNNIVRSKFGTYQKIYDHPLPLVFNRYGDTAFIFTLNDEVKNNKKLLFNDLSTTAQASPLLRARFNELQEAFFAAAAGNVRPIFSANPQHLNDDPYDMLKRFKGIRINQQNKDGNSALDLAAASGHLQFVKLLIHHGAFIGPNTLKFATKNNHFEVMKLLQWVMQKT